MRWGLWGLAHCEAPGCGGEQPPSCTWSRCVSVHLAHCCRGVSPAQRKLQSELWVLRGCRQAAQLLGAKPCPNRPDPAWVSLLPSQRHSGRWTQAFLSPLWAEV